MPKKDSPAFKSKKEWEEYAWNKFLKKLASLKSDEVLKVVLESVITPKERQIIMKRVAVLDLIVKGKSYREMGNILWISPSTISAIKKDIGNKTGYRGRKEVLDEPGSDKKISIAAEFIKGFFMELIDMPLPRKVGRGRWGFLAYSGPKKKRNI